MVDDAPTGELRSSELVRNVSRQRGNSRASEHRLSGAVSVLSSDAEFRLGRTRKSTTQAFKRPPYVVHSFINDLGRIAERIRSEFESLEDFRDRVAILTDLYVSLDQLWSVRNSRERPWQKILNAIQAAMKSIEFETVSFQTVDGILKSTELLRGLVDDDDVVSALSILEEAKLSPFSLLKP